MKNYTSTVPVERTISKIEMALAKAGVCSIHKEFKDARVFALCFQLSVDKTTKVAVRLPIDVDAVLGVLTKNVKRPRKGTAERIRDQAERTAWKLLQDWIEVQVSLIEMKQAEMLQVFLPYVWDGRKTFFESLKGSEFRYLLAEHK